MRNQIVLEIRQVHQSLKSLHRALNRLGASVQAAGSTRSTGPRLRRKLTLTPERRAALKLQGQYMGYLRNLKPKQKAGVKALKETKGIRAAIAAAKRMGKAA